MEQANQFPAMLLGKLIDGRRARGVEVNQGAKRLDKVIGKVKPVEFAVMVQAVSREEPCNVRARATDARMMA